MHSRVKNGILQETTCTLPHFVGAGLEVSILGELVVEIGSLPFMFQSVSI